jgi:hypothetical protein
VTTCDDRSPSSPRLDLAVLGLFLLLAVAWTWPLGANLSTRVPHDPGDPILNAWILWWNTQALPFTAPWWSPPIFYPMPGALALSEHLAGIAIVTTPLQAAGVGPLGAYNVALILSFALSGFFAFLLCRRLTGSPLAGFAAGVAFAFAPFRASQLSHLQALTSQWMPLALLAMHAFVDEGGRRWLVIFAAAWLAQSLSNGYYLLFFPVLIVLWLSWFVDWRAARSRGFALVATWIGSSLLLVPGLLHYRQVHDALGLGRTREEMVRFSATLGSFGNAGPMLAFWPPAGADTQEAFLFPGVTMVALVVVAILVGAIRWRQRPGRRSPFVFYAGATLIIWALALGPAPEGSPAMSLLRPYTLLTWLPGFNGLRVPARFAMLAVLCLSIAGGLAFSRLMPARRVRCWAFAALVLTGLWVDGWMRAIPLAYPPGRVILPDVPRSAVIELPVDELLVSTAAMYRAIFHGRPLINGYSGHTPPHYTILSMALRRHDPSVLTELARGRPLVIAVSDRDDSDGAFRRLVEGLPGIERRGASSAGTLYVLPAGPLARRAPEGDPLPMSLDDRPHKVAQIDFGSPRVVRSVSFALRRHYPELGKRLAIEVSQDGSAWTTVWLDWTGGPALAAALENPRDALLRITLPDVTARYMRVYPAPMWLSRELKVYGPR